MGKGQGITIIILAVCFAIALGLLFPTAMYSVVLSNELYSNHLTIDKSIYEVGYDEIIYINRLGEVHYGYILEERCYYVEDEELFHTTLKEAENE